MSSFLPQEMLDLIIDHLHNDLPALKSCCTTSKSWFPRSRKHLFARVEFHTQKSHIELWKEAFPDPSDSPACNTRVLSIRGLPAITAADADGTGWIHTFHRLVKLDLDTFGYDDHQISLVPLHHLSSTLTSLTLCHTSISPSEVFGLVCSFPLLEDLALLSCDGRSDTDGWDVPSTSPKFTGTLDLRSMGGIRSVARQLCDLPNGLHFNKIMVGCLNEDFEPTMDLVSRCFDTLESIRLSFYLASEFPSASVLGLCLTTREYRPIRSSFTRPLKGHETQGCGVPLRKARHSVDRHGSSNHRVQEPSTDHYRLVRSLSEADWGNDQSGMAGPRPSAGPTLDFTFNSPENYKRKVGWWC